MNPVNTPTDATVFCCRAMTTPASGGPHLLREMKAAYSILWVEPAGLSLLGVSSTKIM